MTERVVLNFSQQQTMDNGVKGPLEVHEKHVRFVPFICSLGSMTSSTNRIIFA